jgi:1-acyl-sn-glycerol-3-phosphate acyltransferase
VVLHLAPRHIVPMAKVEVYDYPIVGIFPRIWQVIPVRREEVDRRAIQMALKALKDGEIILVAPEGTRGTGLREGKEGVAYLASRSGAVVVPVALMGTVGFPTFRLFKRWKGPGVHVRIGKPFRYRPGFERAAGEQLRKMTDEAMYLLSALLVEPLRGFYSDLSAATQDTLEELPEPTNLHREGS